MMREDGDHVYAAQIEIHKSSLCLAVEEGITKHDGGKETCVMQESGRVAL